MSEILIIFDKDRMNSYKGALENLAVSYHRWGFKLDKGYAPMVFRGDISLLGGFKELQRDHFDENQILGRLFLFVVASSPIDILRQSVSSFSLFNQGYWQIYNMSINLLLFRVNSCHKIMKNFQSYRKIVNGVYLFFKEDLESLNENAKEYSIFKVYPFGTSLFFETWKKILDF